MEPFILMKKTFYFLFILFLGTNFSFSSNETEVIKDYYSWEKIAGLSSRLAVQIREKETIENIEWKGMVVITRGGLGVATFLTQHLDIRNIQTICLKSYEGAERGKIEVIHKPTGIGSGKDYLFVDDLSDTGKTLELVRGLYPEGFYATLIVKPVGKPQANIYVEEVPQNRWIVFPWEN